MNVSSEKADWFNSLPITKRQSDGDKFERVCHCGATIWYECESLALDSWINIHFNHRQQSPTAKQVKEYQYDFTRKIIFNRLGFNAFCQQFGLKNPGKLATRDVFIDGRGNIFCFFPDYEENEPESDTESRFATFDPQGSRVNL